MVEVIEAITSEAILTHLQQFMLMFRCKPLILLVWISSVLKM